MILIDKITLLRVVLALFFALYFLQGSARNVKQLLVKKRRARATLAKMRGDCALLR